MNNTLGDLNNFLFAELERLDNEEMTTEELDDEVKRAKAITSVSSQIVQTGHLVVKAQKYADDAWSADAKVPKMLSGGD